MGDNTWISIFMETETEVLVLYSQKTVLSLGDG